MVGASAGDNSAKRCMHRRRDWNLKKKKKKKLRNAAERWESTKRVGKFVLPSLRFCVAEGLQSTRSVLAKGGVGLRSEIYRRTSAEQTLSSCCCQLRRHVCSSPQPCAPPITTKLKKNKKTKPLSPPDRDIPPHCSSSRLGVLFFIFAAMFFMH